jgi:hypothetical protein
MYLIKTEIEGIYRDTNNGALLNKDNTSLEAYKKMKKKNIEIDEMKMKINEIDNIKNEMSEIKVLLNRIIEKI